MGSLTNEPLCPDCRAAPISPGRAKCFECMEEQLRKNAPKWKEDGGPARDDPESD